jgi:AcrR family transcriptional regulator
MTASADTLLDAFLTLVAERGYGEVTLRDVAAAADTGLADLYRLYPDKMALVAGVMKRVDAAVRRARSIPRRPRATGCSR